MKNIFKLFSFAILIASVLFVGCGKKKDDTTKPTIKDVSCEPASVKAGEKVTVKATLADDVGLKSVTISGAGDLKVTEDISGKSHSLNKKVTIPADAKAGKYTITVEVADAADNKASEKADVTIVDFIFKVEPEEVKAEEIVKVSGKVNREVSGVKISVSKSESKSATSTPEDWEVEETDARLEADNKSFSLELTVSENPTLGDYIVKAVATAKEGGAKEEKTKTIKVVEE